MFMSVNPGLTREAPCGRITKIRARAAWFFRTSPPPALARPMRLHGPQMLRGINFGRIAGGTSWPPSKAKFAAFAFHEVE
jgi:hypothetical protein